MCVLLTARTEILLGHAGLPSNDWNIIILPISHFAQYDAALQHKSTTANADGSARRCLIHNRQSSWARERSLRRQKTDLLYTFTKPCTDINCSIFFSFHHKRTRGHDKKLVFVNVISPMSRIVVEQFQYTIDWCFERSLTQAFTHSRAFSTFLQFTWLSSVILCSLFFYNHQNAVYCAPIRAGFWPLYCCFINVVKKFPVGPSAREKRSLAGGRELDDRYATARGNILPNSISWVSLKRYEIQA